MRKFCGQMDRASFLASPKKLQNTCIEIVLIYIIIIASINFKIRSYQISVVCLEKHRNTYVHILLHFL